MTIFIASIAIALCISFLCPLVEAASKLYPFSTTSEQPFFAA